MSLTLRLSVQVDLLGPEYNGQKFLAVTIGTRLERSVDNKSSSVPNYGRTDQMSPLRQLMWPWRWESPPGRTAIDPSIKRFGFRTLEGRYVSDSRPLRRGKESGRLEALFAELGEEKQLASGIQYRLLEPGKDASRNSEHNLVGWSHVLEQAMRLPGQIGRDVGLVHFIPLGGINPYAPLFPEFDVMLDSDVVEVRLGTAIADIWGFIDSNILYDLDYQLLVRKNDGSAVQPLLEDRVGKLEVKAQIAFPTRPSRRLSRPAAKVITPEIDPETYWIRFPNDTINWTGKDWFSRLPLDMADAADLVTHFVQSVREIAEKRAASDAGNTDIAAQRDSIAAILVSLLKTFSGPGFGDPSSLKKQIEEQVTWPTPWTANTALQNLKLRKLDASQKLVADVDGVQRLEAAILISAKASTEYPTLLRNFLNGLKQQKPELNEQVDRAIDWLKRSSDLDLRGVANGAEFVVSATREQDATIQLLLDRWGFTSNRRDKDDVRSEVNKAALIEQLKAMPVRRRLILDAIHGFWDKKSDASGQHSIGQDMLDGKSFQEYWAEIYPQIRLPETLEEVHHSAFAFLFGILDAAFKDASAPGLEAFASELRNATRDRLALALKRIGTDTTAVEQQKSRANVGTSPNSNEALLGSRQAVEIPHPLSFIVGDLKPRVLQEGVLDKTQLFAGIGVFVQCSWTGKPDDYGAPYCLTAADVIDTTIGADSRPEALIASGNAPWRVIGQNGLDGWTLSFDGLPITSRPILADYGMQAGDDGRMEPNQLSLGFDARQVEGSRHPSSMQNSNWVRLPALSYGRYFRFCFFGQTNAGGVPAVATNQDDPGTFVLPTRQSLGDLLNKQEGFSYFVEVRYLRRTPIGAPRLIDISPQKEKERSPTAPRDGRSGKPLEFPYIPRQGDWPVYPLVEDLLGRIELGSVRQSPSTATTVQHVSAERLSAEQIGQLVLLTPPESDPRWITWSKTAKSNFTFGVIPPSVSVEDYLRWRYTDLIKARETDSGEAPALEMEITELIAAQHEPKFAPTIVPDPKVSVPTQKDPKLAPKKNADIKAGTELQRERSVDDPAVTAICVRVSQIVPGKAFVPLDMDKALLVELPRAKRMPAGGGVDPLSGWQCNHITFHVNAGEAFSSLNVALSGHTVNINVPEGKIARIEILSLVRADLFIDDESKPAKTTARIRTHMPNTAWDAAELFKEEAPPRFKEYYAMAKTMLTVEVATLIQASREDIWNSIDLLEMTGSELVIGLRNQFSFDEKDDRSKYYPSYLSPHFKRAALNRQLWSWAGRRYTQAPPGAARKLDMLAGTIHALQPPTAKAGTVVVSKRDLEKWDALVAGDGEWFGDRSDLDSLRSNGLLPLPAPDAFNNPVPGSVTEPTVTATVPALHSGPQHRINLDRDLRAQYWRFSVLVENRYSGLMIPQKQITVARNRSPWRRMLIKARPKQKLPKPRLKFILPLTQPVLEDALPAYTSSFLVILDEQWGENAGLAERLEVQISTFDFGDTDGPESLQVGFDPIVASRAVNSAGSQAVTKDIFAVDEWPIGLTYDENIDRPLLATSCFEVTLTGRGSSLLGLSGENLGPDLMARLQFRRNFDTDLTNVPKGVVLESLASDWTAGDWVLFTADARYWLAQGRDHAKPVIARPNNPGQSDVNTPQQDGALRLFLNEEFAICDRKGNPLFILPSQIDVGSPLRRRTYILLTDRIEDATGRLSSERLVGIAEMPVVGVPGGPTPQYWRADTGPLLHPQARLLEVESHRYSDLLYRDQPQSGTPKSTIWEHPLWSSLFPQEPTMSTADPKQSPTSSPYNAPTADARARIRRVSPPIFLRADRGKMH